MSEPTLESLAARLAEVERRLADATADQPRRRDWRKVVGNSEDNEFTRAMLAEIEANSEAERREAQGEIE